jgi:hypothetical protein
MSSRDKDEIGRLFARLTAQLEDAAELAVDGQNRKLSHVSRSKLVMRLRRRFAQAGGTVDSIDVALARAQGGEP